MANRKNNLLLLGIAGGAAAAIYYVIRRQSQAEAAALIARSAGVPAEPPSLMDTILGKVSEEVNGYYDRAKALDVKAKSMGTKTYAAWKAAVKSGSKYFAAETQLTSTVICYETATLRAVSGKCTQSQIDVARLEGYSY